MLSTRQIGIFMFGLGILLAVLVVSFYYSVSSIMVHSACPTAAGCPAHEALPIQTAIGLILVGILVVFSLILIIQEEKVKKVKKTEKKKSEFEVLMSFLNEDEQKIVKAVKEQKGIQQNTLRLKTDLSKAKLSMLLSDLESRGIVRKVASGKTNKVYLKK